MTIRTETMGNRLPEILTDLIVVFTIICGLAFPTKALGISLDVKGVNKDGTEVALTDYRWVIEEDRTFHVEFDGQGNPVADPDTLAVNFHKSYMPVVATGDQSNVGNIDLAPDQHYYASVIPNSAGLYSIGGAAINPGDTSVTVYLNQLPLPTAQITVFVFDDKAPINNAPDLPEEQGLAGFQILVEDAGGRYGISAGAQLADVYGNALGTRYLQTCDASGQNPGSGSSSCLDANGQMLVETDNQGNAIVDPLVTGPDGFLTIKNLAPGKYGVQAVPPAGSTYQQTTTIEGTKVIDAWIKANEPPFFAEFGPAGVHVFIGFVQPFTDSVALNGGQSITGQIANLHLSRPPDTAFFTGALFTHTTPWIGLNSNCGLAGISEGLYANRTNEDGTFTIPNVPPGNYQLVVWDDFLDVVISFQGITVTADGCATANGSCNLGDIGVFQWFTRLENWVFNDIDEDGFRDPGEQGMIEQAVNLRWRDGTVYQSFPTDGEGFVPFDQIFPFFAWQVAEVDFARFKATGVTVTVDDGGPIPFGTERAWGGQLNPQSQGIPPDPDSVSTTATYRVETGTVLTQAFQGFLGQTSVLEWGKAAYGPNENGGISGIVFYSTTRAEDDPSLGAAEPWEPGIPGVTVNLYDVTGTLLLNSTTTDNWDESLPENCQFGSSEQFILTTPNGTKNTGCYDGMRNWNQVRPGIFDGGYAFTSIFVDLNGQPVSPLDPDATEVPMPAGEYVVEVIAPTGYEIVKSQDRNVDFGDTFTPSPQLLAPQCVGPDYTVSDELTLFPGEPANLAGKVLPLCDRKQVFLANGQNAAADFFLFTQVPISAHIFGIILDDTANEFDPNSPQFGEKFAPPWMPIGIYDWTGRLIGQTYSDQFGRFDALVPSTTTANLPQPSGMSPNMLVTCMNDSNPAADPNGLHNAQYSSFCYTFQYMPGTTTYLDTPVVPVAAFTGPDQAPLDCELEQGVPRIFSVTNATNQGPFVAATGETITITSMGTQAVPNPEYDGTNALNILRDYSFGSDPGSVTVGGVPLTNLNWSADGSTITGTVAGGTNTGQLIVTRGDNSLSTEVGVTLHVGLSGSGNNAQEIISVSPGESIQQAINVAGPNDIILVAPGTYEEILIMWKPVRLQGWGAGSTIISAVKRPAEKLVAWRTRVEELISSGAVSLLPGQEVGFGGIEPATLFAEEGAGILVLPRANGARRFALNRNRFARIDGFTITSADTGGGIIANGFADYLQITNNRIINNAGFFGGGIRLGHPNLAEDAQNDHILISHNYISRNGGLNGAGGGISIHDGADSYEVSQNNICGNFTLGNGAGIGHLGLSEAAGNSSPIPSIRNNKITFNQSFNQGLTVSGGGIYVSGQTVINGLTPGTGSLVIDGNLVQGNQAAAGDGGGIALHLINGEDIENNPNLNGNRRAWHHIALTNNMLVNNMSAFAGGGISMQDAVDVRMINNTIANNDSTATAAVAFTPGEPNWSNPQPAGVVSWTHSNDLNNAFGNRAPAALTVPYSNPLMLDNIIWHNRTFHFFGDPGDTPPLYQLKPQVSGVEPGFYWDLAVIGTATQEFLDPQNSILTSLDDTRLSADANGNLVETTTTNAYAATNLTDDPDFIFEYLNGARGVTVKPGEPTTSFGVAAAFDEGGNFIQVRFGPLTIEGSNYHINPGSPAVDSGSPDNGNLIDIDKDIRPAGSNIDMGADEL